MAEFMDMTDENTAPTVEARVKVIVMEHLGVNAEKVVDGAKLEADLGADSLDRIELSMAMEEHFDLTIPDEDSNQLHTVGEVVQYIEGKLKAAA